MGMRTTSNVTATAGVGRVIATPVGTPGAGVNGIGVVVTGGVPAFNISKIKKDFVVGSNIIANHLIVGDKLGRATVGTTGHIDETSGGKFIVKIIKGIKVLLDSIGTIATLFLTPRPHAIVEKAGTNSVFGPSNPAIR